MRVNDFQTYNEAYGMPQPPAEDKRRVETVMLAGMKMRDQAGLVLPFFIPPAVAAAIVQALKDKG